MTMNIDVLLVLLLELLLGRFWAPKWPQHGLQNRSNIASKRSWPPKGRQEASRDAFWAQFGFILDGFWAQLGPPSRSKIDSVPLGSPRSLKERISGPSDLLLHQATTGKQPEPPRGQRQPPENSLNLRGANSNHRKIACTTTGPTERRSKAGAATL